jgi:hypothetical protein
MGHADVKAILTARRGAKPAARAFVRFLAGELRDISEARSIDLSRGSATDKGSAARKAEARAGNTGGRRRPLRA